MPFKTSPAVDASAMAIWVFSVQKDDMVEQEKELVTVEVAMASCCSEVNFSFFLKTFFEKKRLP